MPEVQTSSNRSAGLFFAIVLITGFVILTAVLINNGDSDQSQASGEPVEYQNGISVDTPNGFDFEKRQLTFSGLTYVYAKNVSAPQDYPIRFTVTDYNEPMTVLINQENESSDQSLGGLSDYAEHLANVEAEQASDGNHSNFDKKVEQKDYGYLVTVSSEINLAEDVTMNVYRVYMLDEDSNRLYLIDARSTADVKNTSFIDEIIDSIATS